MSGLPWVRLDSAFPHNWKILDLIAERKHKAVCVYVFGLSYCGAQGTGGYIPRRALMHLHGGKADAATLVQAGLWEEAEEGWLVHDWDHYQPSVEVGESISERARTAICTRWMRQGKECSCGHHRSTQRNTGRNTPRNTRTDERTNELTTVVNLRGIVPVGNAREDGA